MKSTPPSTGYDSAAGPPIIGSPIITRSKDRLDVLLPPSGRNARPGRPLCLLARVGQSLFRRRVRGFRAVLGFAVDEGRRRRIRLLLGGRDQLAVQRRQRTGGVGRPRIAGERERLATAAAEVHGLARTAAAR